MPTKSENERRNEWSPGAKKKEKFSLSKCIWYLELRLLIDWPIGKVQVLFFSDNEMMYGDHV